MPLEFIIVAFLFMNKNRSPEYTAISLMFYSFIVCMVMFAMFRIFGIAWFSQGYISVEVSYVWYRILSSLFHIFEGFIILKILTNKKWYICLIIAIIYDIILKFVHISEIDFIVDIIYIVSIPFIFSNNKKQSIINSTIFIFLISLYQLFMMIGRYDLDIINKYDIGYAVLSFIDYKIFLIVLLLYKRKIKLLKEISMGDDPHCFLFWGKFSEFCKLVGLILLAIISTPLVLITPFYFGADYSYKAIPKQIKVFKEECKKKKEEKNEQTKSE